MEVIDEIPEKDHPYIKKINESLRTKIKLLYKEIEISNKQK